MGEASLSWIELRRQALLNVAGACADMGIFLVRGSQWEEGMSDRKGAWTDGMGRKVRQSTSKQTRVWALLESIILFRDMT